MTRRKIKKVVVIFEDDDTREIDITHTSDEGYDYTALFWDTSAVALLLANYYPAPGAFLTPQLREVVDGTDRTIANCIANTHSAYSENNIFADDVVKFWKNGVTDEGGPIELVLKRGKSPIDGLVLLGHSVSEDDARAFGEHYPDLSGL